MTTHDARGADALDEGPPFAEEIHVPASTARASRTRLFLADDHAMIRDGLKALLSEVLDIEIVGEAGDGWEAVHQVLALAPDVALIDVSMPGLNGIDAVRSIRRRQSSTRLVILTMHTAGDYVRRAFAAGADGYVLKDCAGTEVVAAIRSVRVGRRYVSAEIAELVPKLADGKVPASPLELLSARERQVLQLVVEGWSSAEIARIVSLSPKTVETYRSRMMTKLGVPNLPALVKFALQHGITSLD